MHRPRGGGASLGRNGFCQGTLIVNSFSFTIWVSPTGKTSTFDNPVGLPGKKRPDGQSLITF